VVGVVFLGMATIDYGWLNIGSLLLGLAAWILPLIYILARPIATDRLRIAVPSISLAACSAALVLQIVYQNYLVRTEDWSALMDTSGSLVFISSVLLAGTVVLNAIAFRRAVGQVGARPTREEIEI